MGNKLSRKLKRQNIAKKRRDAAKDANEKVGLFLDIPDECCSCEKKFDKTDKTMVQSWNVIVREEQKLVRLYCPECWERAQVIVKEMREKISEVVNENSE